MRGRPTLFTSYEADGAILRTRVQWFWLLAGLGFLVWLPFVLERSDLILMGTAFVAAIGAIGLNLVTGYAGQVSLGHAFFLAVGAYTGAALSGDPDASVIGFGLDMVLWLPAAGIVAALLGALVAPIAVRLRGLYLALVTIGLVFVGEHVFRNWKELTGGIGVGREPAQLDLFGFRFDTEGELFGVAMIREQKIYFLGLILLVVMALMAKNIARSRVGRAFSAIRDRDIAASVMGVDLTRYKVVAFAVSSFYAGVAGSLLFTVTGFVEPTSFNLVLSVLYIAMVVIGGVATISGAIMGAAFVTLLPRFIELGQDWIWFLGEGGGLTTAQLERILFGVLVVVFLIAEPLGLYGIWFRVRNYWKAWPFSY
jgi:branched-chain amino acid transport system permease protein